MNEIMQDPKWRARQQKWGRIGGRIGARNQPMEAKVKGGRIQGRNNAENKTGFCGRTPEKMKEDGRKGGLKGGQAQVESGRMIPLLGKPAFRLLGT